MIVQRTEQYARREYPNHVRKGPMTILTKSAVIEIDQRSRHRIPCDRRTNLRKRDGYLRRGGENDSECPDIGLCDLPVSVRIPTSQMSDSQHSLRSIAHML